MVCRMTVTHASFVTVPVTDQDRALRFYTEVLGFEVSADLDMPQGRWLQVAPRGAQTVFTLSGPGMGDFEPGSTRGIMWSRPMSTPTAHGWPGRACPYRARTTSRGAGWRPSRTPTATV